MGQWDNGHQASETHNNTHETIAESSLNATSLRRFDAKKLSDRVRTGSCRGMELIWANQTSLILKASNEDPLWAKQLRPLPHWESSNESHSRKANADQSRPECLVLIYARPSGVATRAASRLQETGQESLVRRDAQHVLPRPEVSECQYLTVRARARAL